MNPLRALLLLLLLPLHHCASRDIVDTGPGSPSFAIDRGPPCSMAMYTSDGKRQGRIRHQSERCRIVIDGAELP